MNPEESQLQTTGSFFQRIIKYKIFLIPLIVLILILIPLIFLISSRNESPKSPPAVPSKSKMWEIRFAYDTEKQVLAVKSATLKDGRATTSSFNLSPYKLQILDKDNKVIYQTDVHITEQIVYNIYIPPEATGSAIPVPPQPKEFEDIVYVPYLSNAQKAEVLKQGNKILEFTFPKISSFNLINQAYAIGGVCTTDVKIVLISDGFLEGKFNSLVGQIFNIFNSLSPYSEKPGILDLRSIYNTTSLGCVRPGGQYLNSYSCWDAESTVRGIVFNKFPELQGLDTYHLKIVILTDTDGDPYVIPPRKILGAFNGLGGDYGFFSTKRDILNTAPHEVLGHGVGYLWDRYIYDATSDNGKTKDTLGLESNCSMKSSGADFWQAITGSGGYPGCTSEYLYSAQPRDCGMAGYSGSLMSASGCGGGQFDSVEQAWIKNNIMSNYQSCQSSGVPISSPTLIPTVPAGGNCGAYGCDGPSLRVSWAKNVLAFYGYAIQLTQAGTLSPACNGITNPCEDHAITAETSYTFTGLSPSTKYDLYVYVIQVRPTPDSFWKSYSNLGPTGACQGGFCSPSSIPTLIPTRTLPTGLPPALITPPPGGSTPNPTSSGGSEGASPTPTPTPITTYTCVEDRSKCSQGQKNLQLCASLICTPN